MACIAGNVLDVAVFVVGNTFGNVIFVVRFVHLVLLSPVSAAPNTLVANLAAFEMFGGKAADPGMLDSTEVVWLILSVLVLVLAEEESSTVEVSQEF